MRMTDGFSHLLYSRNMKSITLKERLATSRLCGFFVKMTTKIFFIKPAQTPRKGMVISMDKSLGRDSKLLFAHRFLHTIVYAAVLFLLFRQFYIAALVAFLIKYLLFGFTSEAAAIAQRGFAKSCNFLIRITFPYTLLGKGYYYLVRANMAAGVKKDAELAFQYAQKALNYDLYTDNNRAGLYSLLSLLFFDKGQCDSAWSYLALAKDTPHDPSLNERLAFIENSFIEHQNQTGSSM